MEVSGRLFTREVYIVIGNSEYEDLWETEDRKSYGNSKWTSKQR